LRDEIEAAGWRVVDSGTDFGLEPQHPPDVEVGGSVLYGRSGAVPSLLEELATSRATVVVLAGDHPEDLARATDSVLANLPVGTDLVVVADDPAAPVAERLEKLVGSSEVVSTSERLGAGAALNIGLRRSRGEVVVLMDPSIELTGDAVTPLIEALGDPEVAVAGAFGLRTEDLRRFEETTDAGPVAAIEAYLMAFRRADAAQRGPVDEAFRFYRNLDIWWSLVLRDGGPDAIPRRALVVPGLPIVRHEHRGWSSVEPAERERLSKRNFYRVLDRFRDRPDLAVGS
jgi:glycosyltransferase involved in cell wall biosynthesis